MTTDAVICVEVAYARPDVQRLVTLQVPPGTTLREALRRSGLAEEFTEIDLATAPLGLFGRQIHDEARVLESGDRVEVYRPLLMDPKQARRQRAQAERDG